jgi:hypothetical protein
MTASNLAPIRFAGVSQVTATLGSNDPQVGDRCEEGGNSYVFVYNNGTSQISPGYGATVTAATGYSCTVSTITATDWVIGVCKNATITTNTYGWLVTRGFVTVIMQATCSAAAGGYVGVAADGLFSAVPTSANTDTVIPQRFGKFMSAAASGASVGCYIHCFT